jgi:hypothetical protein
VRWLPTVVATLALLAGLWNAVGLWRLNARLTAFERAVETARSSRAAATAPGPAGGGPMREALARFAEDEGIDQRTMDRVLAELEERYDGMAVTREDLRAGVIGPAAARQEIEELRAASDEALVRILGERRFEELMGRLAEIAAERAPPP